MSTTTNPYPPLQGLHGIGFHGTNDANGLQQKPTFVKPYKTVISSTLLFENI
jgi:hypothetical protein